MKILFVWILHGVKAFRYSIQGLRIAFRDEVAIRQEWVLAIPHFAAIVLLPISLPLRLYLAALWFVLLAIELLNTAVEAVVNLVSPEQHPLAGKAKDCGSAAVFCMLMLIGLSWILVVAKLI